MLINFKQSCKTVVINLIKTILKRARTYLTFCWKG